MNAFILYTIKHGPNVLVFKDFIDMVNDKWAVKQSRGAKKLKVSLDARMYDTSAQYAWQECI